MPSEDVANFVSTNSLNFFGILVGWDKYFCHWLVGSE